jgi:hypothetical protein
MSYVREAPAPTLPNGLGRGGGSRDVVGSMGAKEQLPRLVPTETDEFLRREHAAMVAFQVEPQILCKHRTAIVRQASGVVVELAHNVPPSFLDHNHYLMVVKSAAIQEGR